MPLKRRNSQRSNMNRIPHRVAAMDELEAEHGQCVDTRYAQVDAVEHGSGYVDAAMPDGSVESARRQGGDRIIIVLVVREGGVGSWHRVVREDRVTCRRGVVSAPCRYRYCCFRQTLDSTTDTDQQATTDRKVR